MNSTGDGDLVIAARSALLDALQALRPYRDAVIVIGAQAIYLRTGAVYRLLVGVSTDHFASTLRRLRSDNVAGQATRQALAFLAELFNAGPDALGCLMAGRAEEGVGNPATVSSSAAIFAADLLAALR